MGADVGDPSGARRPTSRRRALVVAWSVASAIAVVAAASTALDRDGAHAQVAAPASRPPTERPRPVSPRRPPPAPAPAVVPRASWVDTRAHVLTARGGRITIRTDGTSSVARGGTAGDTRVVWLAPGVAPTTDQRSCATWQRFGGHEGQPGVALRVRDDGGRIRAITVTNNVLYELRWAFNVHVWDTAARTADGAVAIRQIGQVRLGPTFYRDGAYVPLPWRMCARVEGATVSFKVWPLIDPEPSWGDVRYGGSVALPAGFVFSGRPGWYAGHLLAGEELAQTDQVVGPADGRVVPDPKLGHRPPRP